MKRLLFLTCALTLAGAVQADFPAMALTAKQISDQATAESRSLQIIERQPDGRVRMTAPMQAMEALIGPDGMELRSVNAGGDAVFGWRLEAVGRAGSSQSIPPFFRRGARGDAREARAVTDTGKVIIEGERVAVLRPQAIEEFTASADGIRQDFIVPHPPRSGEGELLLELAAKGARLENLPDNDQAVTLRMADGRELHYHALHVTDANGRELPARMHAHTETRLRIAVDDAGAQYPIRVDPTFSDADWTAIAGPDFNNVIYAVVFGDDALYVGGNFTDSPAGPANYIARWDGNTWLAPGDGMNDTVRALVWDAASGHLYAGGSFTSAGDNPANQIARWDGSVWSPLGSGSSGDVHALAWDAASGELYAGGEFSSAGGVSANRIARWDGVAWSALGSGMNDTVRALAWDADSGHLYAGGEFTSAGGTSANKIACWDGSTWSAPGGIVSGSVFALAWDAENSHLYVGGSFVSALADYVARWDANTETWSALGSGMNSNVWALAWDSDNDRLFAGGTFTTADGNPVNRIAQWDTDGWSALGDGMNSNVRALAWKSDNDQLFAGGSFTLAGDNPASRIARWGNGTWSALGSGMNGRVRALAWDADSGHLYAGGEFTSAGGGTANYIARWDGSAWWDLDGGMNFNVYALAWDADNDHLYAGGGISLAGGNATDYIARWDGSTWSALEGGMDDPVYALAWDADNGHLYAGGSFFFAGGNSAIRVARWDGSTWSSLGVMNDIVFALVWDSANNHLYAGGRFTSAGGILADRVARWDGSAWSSLGGGVNHEVRALAWDADNEHLYVGGAFTSAGGAGASRIARWDGNDWSPLNSGMNTYVYTLAWDGVNSHLYAAGHFVSAGNIPANYITRWDGGDWWPLGSGTNNSVHALVFDADNLHLYAGGNFASAGGHPARIARAKVRLTQQPPITAIAAPPIVEFGQQNILSITGGAGMGAVNYQLISGSEYCSLIEDTVTGIGVGACTVSATKDGDEDYFPSSDSVEVTVTKATGTLVFDNLGFTYNDNSHEVIAHIDEEPGTTCQANESPIGPDVGDYIVNANCDGINYVASGSDIAIIAQAIGALAFQELNFVYDGNAHEVLAYIVEEPGSICSADESPIGPDAGDYTINATCIGENYFATGSGTATIDKAIGTLAFDNLSFIYDGNTHAITAHIDEETESTCAADESPVGPDVGDYPVTATCDGTNYVANGSATATIAKADQASLKVTADPVSIMVGASSVLSVSGGSGDGEVNLGLTKGEEICELHANTLTGLAVGTCTVTATKAGDTNYHSASATLDLTVTPTDNGVFSDRFESLPQIFRYE